MSELRMAKVTNLSDRPLTDGELARLDREVTERETLAELVNARPEERDVLDLVRRLVTFEKQRRRLRHYERSSDSPGGAR